MGLRLAQNRDISIVSRQKSLQDCECGFICRCSRKLEDGNGVDFSVIGTNFQEMSLVAFGPKRMAHNRAGLFLRKPCLDPYIGSVNGDAVIVDALFNTVETALKNLL